MKRIFLLMIPALLCACNDGGQAAVGESQTRFVGLAQDGMPPTHGARHACMRDVQTHLVWELKSADAGLHNWRNTYSWYDPDADHDEMDYRGTPNNGACEGSACDTWSIVNAANSEKRCGFGDWRMPSRDELYSISDPRRSTPSPKTDLTLFPHTQAAEYWTAHDYSFQPDSAWGWSFEFGHDRVDWKKAPKYVRLVRGTPTNLMAVKE